MDGPPEAAPSRMTGCKIIDSRAIVCDRVSARGRKTDHERVSAELIVCGESFSSSEGKFATSG